MKVCRIALGEETHHWHPARRMRPSQNSTQLLGHRRRIGGVIAGVQGRGTTKHRRMLAETSHLKRRAGVLQAATPSTSVSEHISGFHQSFYASNGSYPTLPLQGACKKNKSEGHTCLTMMKV